MPELMRKHINMLLCSSWTSVILQVNDRYQTGETEINISQHVILCANSQTQSQHGLWEGFHVVQLSLLYKLAVNSLHGSRPTTRPGPGQTAVQRPGLSDLWHNANLCPQRWEPPCAVASSSEGALFSLTEMITEMGGRESELLYNLQRGEWPLREQGPQTLQASLLRTEALVCYFSEIQL